MTGAKIQQSGIGSKGIRKTSGTSRIAKAQHRLSSDKNWKGITYFSSSS